MLRGIALSTEIAACDNDEPSDVAALTPSSSSASALNNGADPSSSELSPVELCFDLLEGPPFSVDMKARGEPRLMLGLNGWLWESCRTVDWRWKVSKLAPAGGNDVTDIA